MGTPYSDVIDVFMQMIFEHKLIVLTETERDGWVEALLFTACAKFNKTCRKDLALRDEENKCFEEELEDKEIDVLCNYMIYEWLKPYIYSSELLRERLSTRDYTEHSPANLIDKINIVFDNARKQARLLAVDYTYSNRDYLEKLQEAINNANKVR